MANLTWFQYDVEEWEDRIAEMHLSLEEEGALMRLTRAAWKATVQGTIPDDNRAFEFILGARWKKLVPFVRQHFVADPENAGRLTSLLFVDLYERALRKHISYSTRGKTGGRPPKAGEKAQSKAASKAAEKAKLSNIGDSENSTSFAASSSLACENTTEVISCAPTEHTTNNTALESARSAGAPRASGADIRAGKLSLVGEIQVPRGTVPGEASTTREELDARGRAIDKAYAEGLQRAALEWKLLHGDEYAALEKAECATRAIAAPPIAGGRQREFFDAAVIERVRAHLNWPTRDVWVEEKTRLGKLDALIRGAA